MRVRGDPREQARLPPLGLVLCTCQELRRRFRARHASEGGERLVRFDRIGSVVTVYRAAQWSRIQTVK